MSADPSCKTCTGTGGWADDLGKWVFCPHCWVESRVAEAAPVTAADLATFRQWFKRKPDAISTDTQPGTDERSEGVDPDRATNTVGEGG